MKKIDALENIAREMVGAGRKLEPDVLFVNRNGVIIAVIVDCFEEAMGLAVQIANAQMPEAAFVEHRDGVYYDNPESERIQRQED